GERSCRSVVEKFLLDAFAVLLPTVVGEGGEVVKDEALVFGVEFCGIVGIAAAPGGAVVVDELAEGCGVGGLLLGASADEREQRSEEGETHVEQPTPAFHFDSGRRCSSRSHPKLLL